MTQIQFYLPTEVIFGRDCVQKAHEVFLRQGKTALIVTGTHSAKVNGALQDVEAVLQQNQQAYRIYDRVMPNPTVDCVYEGAAAAKEAGADFIIAIGGGSPMDAAKTMAWLAAQDIKREELFTRKVTAPVLPIICIPTTAGTGSEVTPYSVLTNDEKQTKMSVASPLLFPAVSLLDGKYMLGLSRTVTIHTALDALSHLLESALSRRASRWSRAVALEGLRMFAPYFKTLDTAEWTAEDRDKLLEASMLGGIAIAQTSTTAVHMLGYALTYFHHIDHGRANALTLGAYMKLVEARQPQEAKEVLTALEVQDAAELTAILARLLGEKEVIMPEQAERYAQEAVGNPKCQSGIIPLSLEDVRQIYAEAFGL